MMAVMAVRRNHVNLHQDRVKCSAQSMNILHLLFPDDLACLHYPDKNWSILRHYASLGHILWYCPVQKRFHIKSCSLWDGLRTIYNYMHNTNTTCTTILHNNSNTEHTNTTDRPLVMIGYKPGVFQETINWHERVNCKIFQVISIIKQLAKS